MARQRDKRSSKSAEEIQGTDVAVYTCPMSTAFDLYNLILTEKNDFGASTKRFCRSRKKKTLSKLQFSDDNYYLVTVTKKIKKNKQKKQINVMVTKK